MSAWKKNDYNNLYIYNKDRLYQYRAVSKVNIRIYSCTCDPYTTTHVNGNSILFTKIRLIDLLQRYGIHKLGSKHLKFKTRRSAI